MRMWIFFAFGSARFAGLTSILAKCGIRKMDAILVTAGFSRVVFQEKRSKKSALGLVTIVIGTLAMLTP